MWPLLCLRRRLGPNRARVGVGVGVGVGGVERCNSGWCEEWGPKHTLGSVLWEGLGYLSPIFAPYSWEEQSLGQEWSWSLLEIRSENRGVTFEVCGDSFFLWRSGPSWPRLMPQVMTVGVSVALSCLGVKIQGLNCDSWRWHSCFPFINSHTGMLRPPEKRGCAFSPELGCTWAGRAAQTLAKGVTPNKAGGRTLATGTWGRSGMKGKHCCKEAPGRERAQVPAGRGELIKLSMVTLGSTLANARQEEAVREQRSCFKTQVTNGQPTDMFCWPT